MVAFFPWQQAQWHRLSTTLASGQLGHAHLFSGRAGVGHHEFAVEFTQLLLCEAPSPAHYCGTCRSCILFDAGNHPDYSLTAPEEEGKTIGVDQIRALADFYALKAHYGGRKVSIISPAENMNRAASNALLKTLEEPPPGATIILVTDRYDAITMTVRSRCQRTSFEHVDRQLAGDWLREQLGDASDEDALLNASCGAPLLALRRDEQGTAAIQAELINCWAELVGGKLNPMSASQQFEGTTAPVLIDELCQLTYQLILLENARLHRADNENTKLNRNLKACINGLNLRDLYAILDVIFEAKRQIFSHTNPRDADLMDTIWLFLGGYAPR
ncbi:MAG: DNA polymerase III subunit delta' [Gammaproteobacteria bacterium]